MSDNVDKILNVIDDRCEKVLNNKQNTLIKTRVGQVAEYDSDSHKAYVIFPDDNKQQTHLYYNKTNEELKAGDQVRIFYTTNIDKGWIGLRLGEPNINVVSEPEWDGVAQILRTNDSRIALKTFESVNKEYEYIEVLRRDKSSLEDEAKYFLRFLDNGSIVLQGASGGFPSQPILEVNNSNGGISYLFSTHNPYAYYPNLQIAPKMFSFRDNDIHFTIGENNNFRYYCRQSLGNFCDVTFSDGHIYMGKDSLKAYIRCGKSYNGIYINNVVIDISSQGAEIYFCEGNMGVEKDKRASFKLYADGTAYLNNKRILTEDDLT